MRRLITLGVLSARKPFAALAELSYRKWNSKGFNFFIIVRDAVDRLTHPVAMHAMFQGWVEH